MKPDPPELGPILGRFGKFMLMGAALVFVTHIGDLPNWVFTVGGFAILIWWLRGKSTIPWGEGRGKR